MGVSIHASYALVDELRSYIFEHQSTFATINKIEDPTELDLINDLLDKFGFVTDDGKWFVVLTNEYYDDYNPLREMEDFLDRYFGITSWSNSFYNMPLTPKWDSGGANAEEIADELGVELAEAELY